MLKSLITNKTIRNIFISLFALAIFIMLGRLFLKRDRQREYRNNKKFYTYNKYWDFKEPVYITTDIKDSANYLKWCFENKKIGVKPITFPFKFIGNGDSLYLIEKISSNLYKMYYPNEDRFSSDVVFIWSGYLINTFPFRGQKSKYDSLQEVKYPSF